MADNGGAPIRSGAEDGGPQARQTAGPWLSPRAGGPSGRGIRRIRLALGLAALAVVLALVLRSHSAASAFVAAFRHFRPARLPWVLVAGALETASLACSALVQRRLLRSENRTVAFRTLMTLVVASTAVVDLVPAGVAPSSGWLVEQYRARRVPVALGLWVVLAAGFAATVTELGLVIVGAGVAGLGSPVGLALSGAVLVGGSAGFVALAHRLGRRQPPLSGRLRRAPLRSAALTVERASRFRMSRSGGVAVLGYSTLNWLLDCGCLVVAFVLIGLPVPWSAVLFAYTASQALGGISFLRIGVVEGGLVGAFALAGARPGPVLAAILMYRVLAYWMVAGIGAVVFVVVNHRQLARERGGGGPTAAEGGERRHLG